MTFIPVLTQFYRKCQEKSPDYFEIVYVSFDRDQSSKSQVPWVSVPLGSLPAQALAQRWRVSTIPRLVILDGSSRRVVNYDARSFLTSDVEGARFPWPADNMPSLAGTLLQRLLSPLGLLFIFFMFYFFVYK